jgi:anti-sigma factor ChrR (cupin superfamily)
MTPASDTHDREYPKLVLLYALQVLPSSEVSGVGGHIAACPACRQELETVRPIIESLAAWPTDLLRPSASLWDRLAQRIAAETGQEPASLAPGRPWEPEWQEAAPGISVQLLATDTEKHRISMLVRLAPATEYPAHRHAGVEELHLLQGELMIGDRRLYPGDYNRAEPGTVDHRVWSETGCTCVLITSLHDALL